jgi:hypothetical protein
MVLALYVLAGLMVAGGLTAIYSGSDIIVMERGWTMVIAGSVFTACGALLAGVATAVARLQDLEGEFSRLSDRLQPPQAPSFAPSSDMVAERASPAERTGTPPLVAVPEIKEHRSLDIVPEPILSAPPAPPAPPAPEAAAAGPMPAPEGSGGAEAPTPVADLDEAIFAREPAPQAAPPEAATKSSPPTIVGTYNSGGNFYVMYSDGSIEAETPAGKFRFDSLDELKEFIAAGGDKAKATS